MTHIHTVTTISHHPDKPAHRSDPRCWGYYLTREEARAGMQGRCDDEAGYYTHAVIERYAPGIYTRADQAEWYEYSRAAKVWAAISEPEFARNVVNFAIG